METVTVPLTKGYTALIDAADAERVLSRTWFVRFQRKVPYAACHDSRPSGRMMMHRFILDAPPGQPVDHRNTDGLDNRRENLRFCTTIQNSRNSKNRLWAASKYKGVTRNNRRRSPWVARIRVNGRNIALRTHRTEEAAARAYDVAALLHFGEFARLNFPQENAA